MTWPTNGYLATGWEALGTVITTDPEPDPLPAVFRARWFDPSLLSGLGTLIPSVGLTVGNAAVEVRQRSARLEVTLTRREMRGVALLDSFSAEVLVGLPCSVLLTVYEDDRATVAWEASTDPDHATPFLVEPDNYGEQELDVAKGSATIGTVRVTIVDRRRTAGDQDSGWVTYRLAEQGLAALAGRRARLVRFIDPAVGYQVVADGPIGTPQMDRSYAAFAFTIRDTRETERKSRLTRGGDRALLPFGVVNGYGPTGPGTWLLPPVTFLTGTFAYSLLPPNLPWVGWGQTDYQIDISANAAGLRTIPIEAFEALENVAHRSGLENSFPYYTLIPVGVTFRWRLASTSNPWTEIILTGEGDEPSVMLTQITLDGNGDVVVGQLLFTTQGFGLPTLATGPIEFQIIGGKGTLAPGLPFYLDGLTAGEFLKNAYDGLYSDLGPGGVIVPTGIRYDEPALLQMTDLVRLRLFEEVADLRKWLEEHIYAPTGWVPALDFDGRVSPVSQNVPTDVLALEAITDAITEPAPEWSSGETVYNVIRFSYRRDYIPTDPANAQTPDGLAAREVILEYEDSLSVDRHGRRVLDLSGEAFRAVGDPDAVPIDVPEVGGGLADERGTQLLNRYSLGAPALQVAIMRREVPLLRAGEWVVVSLSWFPDYVTRRRALVAVAQVVALNDLDCAWRRVVLEVVNTFPSS